ncbi:hypothetical protein [Arthrobacter methylotrophus]|uniref:Acyl-CoA dehydrogenase n=1 Tax=Arthrobacter methylotrophus TaxID=121291 RepID=A0ABV5UV03_9MICC
MVNAGPRPVRISSPPGRLEATVPLLESLRDAVGDVPAILALALKIGRTAPRTGEGDTAHLWEPLACVTAVDVAAGRVLEPHLDAISILTQAEFNAGTGAGPDALEQARDTEDQTWGVFAAEASGLRLEAAPGGAGGYVLNGSKPWCSLAGQLDRAVVTAYLAGGASSGDPGGGARAAFAVRLHDPGVFCETPQWSSRSLREIPSGTVRFEGVCAVPVGGPGWYFERPGFAWGGMGVAACWLGGTIAVARDFRSALATAAKGGSEPDQIALAHLGETDRTIMSLIGCLARAAARIDAGDLSGPEARSEALRVRGAVAAGVERIQAMVVQNLGPGPLAFNETYGKRMADLSLYIRQHHAMRDDAQLGALTLKGDTSW